jgi:DUF1680 family protein
MLKKLHIRVPITWYLLVLLTLCAQFHLKAQQIFQAPILKAIPFDNRDVTLYSSWVQRREDLNTTYLKSLDPERLLHNFRVNAKLPSTAKPLEGWEAPGIGIRGHFVGHYLSAISNLVQRYKDPVLTQRLTYMVNELEKCQLALGNGYLSAFPEKDFDLLETRFGGVWAPYYTYHKIMQGLLDTYVRTGNKKAYAMVLNMASYVEKRMAKLDAPTIDKVLYSVEANPGNEAGAMNEVLYKLYAISKNPQHLALAKIFDRDWLLQPLAKNKDILSGLHSNTHLVLVNGFARRYELTGEKLYNDAVSNFWEMLIGSHVYANGSSSGPRPNATTTTSLTAEHWGVPNQLSNTMTKEIAESCVSHNTQKLTASLFEWTANAKYADMYMNTFYNAVMALQNAHTGQSVYHLPLGSPRRKVFLKENDFRCCNGTTVEAFAMLNSNIYFHNDSTLWVNLYVPSKVNWASKNITLAQTGNFPSDTTVEFSLTAKKKIAFALKLLVPSWAGMADLYINNQKQNISVMPGTYISLSREWKNNDKVKLVFHYKFYLKAMPDDKNVVALFYGPTLMAFESNNELILRGAQQNVLNDIKASDKTQLIFTLNNNGKNYKLCPLFDIDTQSYGVYATFREF